MLYWIVEEVLSKKSSPLNTIEIMQKFSNALSHNNNDYVFSPVVPARKVGTFIFCTFAVGFSHLLEIQKPRRVAGLERKR